MNDAPCLCSHCGAPIPAHVRITEELNGTRQSFCCHGCHLAYQIICGAGLSRYYQTRQFDSCGLPSGAYTTNYDDDYLARFLVPAAQPSEVQLSFLVDGVRCASCVWVIEQVLERIPGVSRARLNYGTHRALVSFDPGQVAPSLLLSELGRLGYVPRPFSLDAAQQGATREGRTLLIRFGTAALFSMQVMGFTVPLYAGYFQGIDPQSRAVMTWLAALTSLPVVFYSGWPFLHGAWRSLRNRSANMDLLVALGVLCIFFYSLVSLLLGGEVYFDSAAMIITLILLGRLLEHYARQKAMSRIDRLLQLAPDTAQKIVDGTLISTASRELKPGDEILVRPGERFPVDGTIITGTTDIDEAAITGEALPVTRGPTGEVAGGTINLTVAVTVRVSRSSADSLIARIARLVEDALAQRAPIQRLADRVSAYFVPAILLLAAATALAWLASGAEIGTSLMHAVAVLVVACPCALGLATPMAILVATGTAARSGILFRGGDVIERTSKITAVAFDKTGTLTEGRPQLLAVRPATGCTEGQLLGNAAQAAVSSNHPLASGILRALHEDQRIALPEPLPNRAVPGRGVVLDLPCGELRMGNRAHLLEAGIAVPDTSCEALTEVHLSLGNAYLGVLLFEDLLRDDAAEAVASLAALHIQTAMLTGDRKATAHRIAALAGINMVAAELTPEEKAAWIRRHEADKGPVMMVGDGINDAPALSGATVGCAMVGGTDIALETSDLVLARPSLRRLVEAITLARRCVRVIRENLFWAFIYNLLTLPLAATGHLLPIHAAAAMSLSSLCVVGNSLRLARGHRSPPC